MLSINGGIIIQGSYVKKMLAGETIIGNPTTHDCDKNLVKEELKKLMTMEEGSNKRAASGGSSSRARRHCRQKKLNHEAIDILRRVVLVIVLIEMMLAVSESSLMSTFFLFLTMSTTFEVKPENVLDTYCYYEPGGNSMCEDYMGRATGYSPSTTHHYRAASTNARSYYNYNFPNVSPSLEDQSYELFLAFNQSFYDAPARFNMELELDSGARHARLSKLFQTFLAEIGNNNTNNNSTGTNNNDTHDIFSSQILSSKKMKLSSLIESHLRQTVEILEPSAPFLLNKEIPQVMDAMRRSKAKQAPQTNININQNQAKANKPAAADADLKKEEIDKLFHHLSTPPQPFPIQYHGLKKKDYKNTMQNKDFIGHRWKRESTSTRQPSIQVPHETVVSPNITNSTKRTEKAFSSGKNGNDQQTNMKNALMNEKTAHSKEMQDDHHPTLIPNIEPTPISTSPTFDKGGDELLREYMKAHLLATRTESEKQMSVESYLTLAMMNKKTANSDDILKTLRSEFKQQTQQQQHQKSSDSSKKKAPRVSPKYFQELYSKLEKSPRHLLALMETSLFNNWKCVLELTKFMYRKNGGGVGAGCRDCSGAKELFDDFPGSEATRLEIIQNLSLSMDMDIFHPKTYQKAERRKRAMQQTYHDYASAIMKELTELKDLPVSHSFYMAFMVIKMYALLWHVILGLILFLGCVMEDKTALNIWGIFAILTSLLHFLIEEWIDTNFQPDKTAACLWFSIIFRVYKPVAVLVVITLSSEILKRDGCSRHRGMGTCLFELVRGKKHPKKQSDKGNSSGDGFPTAVTVTKVQFRRAELENGKIVYTNLSPSKAALYTKATCVICGATAKFAKHRTVDGKPVISSETTAATPDCNEDGKNNNGNPPVPKHGIHCSQCIKTTHYGRDELFEFSEVEEEDDEEEELEIVGDEEDDDTEDEDGYEYEKQEADGLVTEEDQPIYVNQAEKKKQTAMVVILSEGKKYGSKKEEPEPSVIKQTGKDKIDDKNNNNKENLGGVNPLIVGDRSEVVAVVDGADLYI